MSFSKDVKSEIINYSYKNPCCRHALLEGALIAKGCVVNEAIECSIESDELAQFLSGIAKEFIHSPSVTTATCGGRRRIFSFQAHSLERILSYADAGNYFPNHKCGFCSSAFLRGIFLSSGRVTDPQKQFCLEFSVGNRILLIKDLFLEFGFDMKINDRASERILYTKNSGVIEDFFSFAQLNSTAFVIMNEKIKNEFKNNANRMRNFDTVNIAKAVEAANAHLTVIRELNDRGLLSSLPQELEATARLRLQHPDMSLSRLSMISVPPVSKSGLSHRLAKIKKLGEELLSKYR